MVKLSACTHGVLDKYQVTQGDNRLN